MRFLAQYSFLNLFSQITELHINGGTWLQIVRFTCPLQCLFVESFLTSVDLNIHVYFLWSEVFLFIVRNLDVEFEVGVVQTTDHVHGFK